MIQMLSGPTLHRVLLDVPLPHGRSSPTQVDAHVRLAGAQSYEPYITTEYLEKLGEYLRSLSEDVYQEFVNPLLQVSTSVI